jgi:hypothetical protein
MKSLKSMTRVTMMAAAIVASAATPARALHAQGEMVAVSDPQVKDDLFAGTEKFATGASDVTEVNLDPKMLGMLGKGTSADLARKMDFFVVHSYTYDKPGMYKSEDLEIFRKRLVDGNWNCFIHTRDKSGSTDICQRTGADNETHEMVIMTAEPTELTFVHLRGKMTLDDLRKMGGKMGVAVPDGSDNLKSHKDQPKDE